MKTKNWWFTVGLPLGAVSLILVRRYAANRAQGIAWQKRQRAALDVLACPDCHGRLSVSAPPEGEGYCCLTCQKNYPMVDGITHFIQPEELSGLNGTFARLYDWFSWGYRAFSKIAFAYIGLTEEQARREVTDRLEPKGGRILEVSIGPGVNLPYLVDRSDVGEIYGLDISLGQLNRCRDYVGRQRWNVHLELGNAEQLPYQDNTFSGVFHIGGINFFSNKKAAIDEMIRVAKPGARIVIADETEKGAQSYERFIPGFKQAFVGKRDIIQPPLDLIPASMVETRVADIWNGWLYCIEFCKP